MKPFALFYLVGLVVIPVLASAMDKPPVGIPYVSTDGAFEAFSRPAGVQDDVNGKPFYFGEQLYIRLHGTDDRGLLLLENGRYMRIQWAPKSHLLGVEDHWDGHASIVYVYDISTETKSGHIQYKLVFRSPNNDYDRKWFIEGWDVPHRKIRLRLEQRGGEDILGHENWPDSLVKYQIFDIGTKALSEKE